MGERYMLRRIWEKWAPTAIGSSEKPLTGAALLNLASDPPFRIYPPLMEQEGFSLQQAEARSIVQSIQEKCLHLDYFTIGLRRYIVTYVNENVYGARCLNPANLEGSGAIVVCTLFNAMLATYDGSIGAASKAMATIEIFFDELMLTFAS